MTVHYLRPSPDRIIEGARLGGNGGLTDLHAEMAHHAALEDARAIIRQGADHVTPERLDAAIETLKTGDAYDRFLAEELAEARAQKTVRAAVDAWAEEGDDTGHPAGAAAWFVAGLLFMLMIAALVLWVGASRADRPAGCQFMTPSECIAWAQEQEGAR